MPSSLPPPVVTRAVQGSADPGDLVDLAAIHAECGMVIAHGLGIRRIQEAVHLAIRVMEQLDLPDAELIGCAVMSTLGNAVDCFLRQFQVRVKVHELRHRVVLQSQVRAPHRTPSAPLPWEPGPR
jgi:hypothetical protein